jgi:hypothetical protein
MNVYTGIYGNNPGGTLNLARNESDGLLVPASQSWPVYLGDTTRLSQAGPCPAGVVNAACNLDTPAYPIPVRGARADSLSFVSRFLDPFADGKRLFRCADYDLAATAVAAGALCLAFRAPGL